MYHESSCLVRPSVGSTVYEEVAQVLPATLPCELEPGRDAECHRSDAELHAELHTASPDWSSLVAHVHKEESGDFRQHVASEHPREIQDWSALMTAIADHESTGGAPRGLEVGMTVVMINMENPQMNGGLGVLEGWSAQMSAWFVRVGSGGIQTVLVDNLMAVTD